MKLKILYFQKTEHGWLREVGESWSKVLTTIEMIHKTDYDVLVK